MSSQHVYIWQCNDVILNYVFKVQSPNMALSLVAYGDSSDSESEEPSVPEKKDSGTDVRKLLSVLPPAKSKSGGGKTVRIGLPKLEKGVS